MLPVLLLPLLLAASSASAQVSVFDKAKIFEKVWKTVNEKYYNPHFNGVDGNKMRERQQPDSKKTTPSVTR